MFKDQSLIPAEATRLAALGFLAELPLSYAELATRVRHLTSRVAGPSLDLISAPLELLRFEGLVLAEGDEAAPAEQRRLSLTERGRAEFERLMQASVRAPVNDLGKLVIALKLKFLHLVTAADAARQADLLVELNERELARLRDLRASEGEGIGHLAGWLDLEIAAVAGRLDWFRALRDRVSESTPT
ncbi:MAG: hypothetical protein JNK11_03195 [Alphaproteobacteria bacterium]|nr:hypothetical protein [Alphaproteobacteria bacterium]